MLGHEPLPFAPVDTTAVPLWNVQFCAYAEFVAVELKVIGVLIKLGPAGTAKSAVGGLTDLTLTSKSKMLP